MYLIVEKNGNRVTVDEVMKGFPELYLESKPESEHHNELPQALYLLLRLLNHTARAAEILGDKKGEVYTINLTTESPEYILYLRQNGDYNILFDVKKITV